VSLLLKGVREEKEGKNTARRRRKKNNFAVHYLVGFYLIGMQAVIDFEF
jgi:hypothetical protein